MQSEIQEINVTELIGEGSVSRFQVLVIALCAIVAVLDGFDTQSIAFAAPVIAQEWGVDPSLFGPVFSSALAGLAIGALTLGTFADRVGRKTVIVGSTLAFGIFSFATAYAESLNQIMTLRFLTGLGLGGAIPNIIALTSEYAPRRLRVLLVASMASGFPLGGFIGGVVSAKLITAFGWQSVFIVGGFLPLLLAPVLLLKLPESIPFLLRRNLASSRQRVAEYLSRIAPERRISAATQFLLSEERLPGAGVAQLFTSRRALGTLMLWVTFFTNLLMFYFLVSWLPTVFSGAGLAVESAIITAAVLNAGTVLGGVVLGYMIDTKGPFKVLTLNYFGAAVFTMLIGFSGDAFVALLVLVFFAGFCVGGGQLAVVGFAASFYPTDVRSTGVGWAFGMGRCGAIVGPIVGGFLLAQEVSTQTLFMLCGIPGMVAALAVYLMWRTERSEQTARFASFTLPR